MTRPDYTLPLDQLPDPLPIEPLSKPFDVTITPPGSKSITCRAYVLAALAKGESKLVRPLRADDTDLLLKALCTLGAEARWEGEDVYIRGVGGRFPRGGSVNLGDGGTPTRFMIACACLAAEPVIVDGSKRMRERPIAEGVDMLRQLGAKIAYIEAEGRLPVRVMPSEIKGGDITPKRTTTSQFVSAALLIGTFLPQGVRVSYADVPASESYVVLTLKVIDDWNALVAGKIIGDRGRCSVKPWSVVARDYAIEPDASSAAYWIVACTLRAENRLSVLNVSRYSNQPDVSLVGAIEDLGMIADLGHENLVLEGTGGHESKDRERDVFDFSLMPDAAMAFASSAAVQSYRIRIIGLRTLRVKETDRITALANELRKVGCVVETGEDWIEIAPPKKGGTGVPPVPADRRVGETLQRRRRNLPHWQLGGSTYFVTFRVREGELSHDERRIVASACRHWHDQRMVLHLGVVMHDHVHLLITPLRSGTDAAGQPVYDSLSELMQSIKSFSAHEIQRLRNSSGPFWQEESYDRIMRDDEEYLEKWNYMLNNPAEAGLVKRGEEYEHFVRGVHGTGGTPVLPDPIIIETYNDHRMAMAFAVLGLAAPNGQRLAIRNPACVAKSYPTFWQDFAKLYQ